MIQLAAVPSVASEHKKLYAMQLLRYFAADAASIPSDRLGFLIKKLVEVNFRRPVNRGEGKEVGQEEARAFGYRSAIFARLKWYDRLSSTMKALLVITAVSPQRPAGRHCTPSSVLGLPNRPYSWKSPPLRCSISPSTQWKVLHYPTHSKLQQTSRRRNVSSFSNVCFSSDVTGATIEFLPSILQLLLALFQPVADAGQTSKVFTYTKILLVLNFLANGYSLKR